MRKSEFRDYVVHDLLSNFGVTSRAMFGGFGIYKNGVICGIIVDGELYFKIDDASKKDFEAIGSHPFTYEKSNGKKVSLSAYWLVVEELMEDQEKFEAAFKRCVKTVS